MEIARVTTCFIEVEVAQAELVAMVCERAGIAIDKGDVTVCFAFGDEGYGRQITNGLKLKVNETTRVSEPVR